MGSTRLPGKILKEVKGLPLLGHEIKRVELAKKISKIVLATTTLPEDDKTEEFCKKINIACFRGSVDDVLDRYYEAATEFGSFDAVMRLTGDCPLIDPIILDQLVEFFEQGRFDYASNVGKETFPDGMDAEIFTVKALEEAYREARLKSEREHVTSYIRKSNHFKKGNLESSGDYSAYRFTVDNPEDFEVIKFIIENSDEILVI